MEFSREAETKETDDLKAQVALLEDQLMTAQAMLEAEAKARIALEELMQSAPDP